MPSARALAAAQTVPRPGDVAANVAQHLRLAQLVGEEDVDVLLFPELSLTGYELRRAHELAFTPDDSRLEPLVEAARRGSTTLVVGAPVRVQERLHLGAFVLAPSGDIEVYTKRHLGAFSPAAGIDGAVPPPEASVFAPGALDPCVALHDHRVAALAICADTARPCHPQRAAERGATVYLASMFVIPSDFESEARRLAGYASRHAMTVVMANFGGPSGGLAAAGRSSIWSPRGERLGELPPEGPGVILTTMTEAGPRTTVRRLRGA